MSEPRYFGIALTLDELHKILGLPEDVKIERAETNCHVTWKQKPDELSVMLTLSGPADRYDGAGYNAKAAVFRPDIQTRTVSQVVIHQLKEK